MRAALQLNLFGVVFPITLTVAFVMLALTVPYLAVTLDLLFAEAFEIMQQLPNCLPNHHDSPLPPRTSETFLGSTN